MVKRIEVEVLLRNFLDCYDSPCPMPIKFPASLSQITPVQYPCERKGFKKTLTMRTSILPKLFLLF